MPWHVARGHGCPASRPWAVVKDATGEAVGCHPSRQAALSHLQALHATEASEDQAAQGEHMTDIERRFTAFPVEARRADGDARRKIGGYAAVFNRLSQNLGGFVEQIDPTAFNKSRGDGWPDVVARFDHENAFLLGTTVGQTLRLEVDGTGLFYEVDVPTARADVYELVERGDVRKSSFAFRVYPEGDTWGVSDQGFPLRTIHSAQLVDVAPVVSPAYADTTAGLRSLAAKVGAELEEVRAAAQAGELHRFVAGDGDPKPGPKPKPRLFGPAARALLDARRDDQAA